MPPASTSAERVARRRAALGVQGLRAIRIRVLDTRTPGVAEECARQAAIVDAANHADPELMQFMNAASAATNRRPAANGRRHNRTDLGPYRVLTTHKAHVRENRSLSAEVWRPIRRAVPFSSRFRSLVMAQRGVFTTKGEPDEDCA